MSHHRHRERERSENRAEHERTNHDNRERDILVYDGLVVASQAKGVNASTFPPLYNPNSGSRWLHQHRARQFRSYFEPLAIFGFASDKLAASQKSQLLLLANAERA